MFAGTAAVVAACVAVVVVVAAGAAVVVVVAGADAVVAVLFFPHETVKTRTIARTSKIAASFFNLFILFLLKKCFPNLCKRLNLLYHFYLHLS